MSKSKKGKAARRKGHQFERKIANDFKEIGWPDARRLPEYHKDDANGVDIQNVQPFLIQCKDRIKYTSINTINEIQTDKFPQDSVPILITKGKGKQYPPMAVLPWKELKEIINAAYGYGD